MSNNPLAAFLAACTEPVTDDDPLFPMSAIQSAVLYAAYVKFMKRREPISHAAFGRFAARCLTRERRNTGVFYGPLKFKGKD